MSQDIQVELDEVINAFEMILMTDDAFSRFFVNTHTGKIVTFFEGNDFSDIEDLEEDLIPEHYIELPEKEELSEYEMMEAFCCSIKNEKIQEDLFQAIQGKGAFGRFKTAIHCHNIQNNWYKFREESLKESAIAFCERHGLMYHFSPEK